MIALGAQTSWVKSSESTGTNNCVEVRSTEPDAVDVRDSKQPEGPALRLSPETFAALVRTI